MTAALGERLGDITEGSPKPWKSIPKPNVRLTAYADTTATIDAINEARIHYYLMEDPGIRRKKLFPAIDDLLHGLEFHLPPALRGHPRSRYPLVQPFLRASRFSRAQ